MTITFPVDTRLTVNAIRGVIGRDIYFNVTTSTSGCSVCSLDTVNNTSKDPFCPACSGMYWFITSEEVGISGHVIWGPHEQPDFTTGGIVDLGDCIVTIEHTNYNIGIVTSANYITVDGKKMVLNRYALRGKPAINRIRLYLKEG